MLFFKQKFTVDANFRICATLLSSDVVLDNITQITTLLFSPAFFYHIILYYA